MGTQGEGFRVPQLPEAREHNACGIVVCGKTKRKYSDENAPNVRFFLRMV